MRRPFAALELEPEPGLIADDLRRIGRDLGERRVKVVVLLRAHLEVVVGRGRGRAEQRPRRRVEVDRRDVVMGIGEAVGALAREAMSGQAARQLGGQGLPARGRHEVLRLLALGGHARVRALAVGSWGLGVMARQGTRE